MIRGKDTVKNKEDMRIIKTKKAIEEAFLALMEQEDYEKISIKDICSQAMIGNATFYYHYSSKQDLAEQLARKFLSELRSVILWQVSMFEQGKNPSEIWEQTKAAKDTLTRKRNVFLKIHFDNFDFIHEQLHMFEEIVMLRYFKNELDDDEYAMRVNIAARQLMSYYIFVEETGNYISAVDFFRIERETMHEYYGPLLETLMNKE